MGPSQSTGKSSHQDHSNKRKPSRQSLSFKELCTAPCNQTTSIVLSFTDRDGESHPTMICNNYPTEILLRFSSVARHQILEQGNRSFEITSKVRCWHDAIVDSIDCILIYLSEMACAPRASLSCKEPPFIYAHFQHGLTHAFLFLETLHAFGLDEVYKQDDWVRRWIMFWIANYDVLPHELACVWQLFKDDRIENDIVEVSIARAAEIWEKDTLYFVEDQATWIIETEILDGELWEIVSEQMDRQRGKGTFANLWSSARASHNLRSRSWFEDMGKNPYLTDAQVLTTRCRQRRDQLQLNRVVHCQILREISGVPTPTPSLAGQGKAMVEDGTRGVEVLINDRNERIKRWSISNAKVSA